MVPYVWQLVLSQVTIEGRVLDADEMASLMVQEWLLTSLCIMLSCSGSIGCPIVVLCRWKGEGTLICSLTYRLVVAVSVMPLVVVSAIMG